MEFNNIDKIVAESVAFLKDDCTELWLITAKIIEENPQLDLKELRQATTKVINQIESFNELKIVDIKTEKQILLPKGEISKFVENHLSKINKIPDIGDGIWMAI